jgi:type I restriction enzyme S subunit
MAGDWKVARLKDVAAGIQTGPFGSQLHASDYVPSGVPVVMPTNIRDRRIDTEGISFIGDEDADRLSRHKLRLNDLVFSRRGEVDKCALVTRDTVGWLCGTGCLLVRPDEKKCDPAFLSFHISAPDTREWLKQHAVGLVMPNLNTEILSSIPLNLPSLGEQRRIADLLGSLDDKIELNRRMAATLEEIARALFKSWFVDFDPVRAKAEGRATGLPDPTAAVFPSRFGDDGVPEGWRSGTLDDTAHLNPESLRSTVRQGEIAYVDLANTKLGVIEDIQHYAPEDAPSRAQRVLRPGDTIVGTVRPGNGSYALVASDGMVGSTGFAVLRPKRLQLREFIYLAATSGNNIEVLAALADGGAYPAVRPDMVADTPCCVPTPEVLEAFHQACARLIDRAETARSESAVLRDLRDTLLPKLISGELRIKDAEKIVAAA